MTFRLSFPAALTSLALAMAAHAIHAEPTATVLVTAARTPQALADVISDSVTISPEQIAQSGAGSVIDLLRRQRGIEVSRNGGPGASASVFIRGANSNQNIVLVDGVRIGSSTTGAANWSAIPLEAIDHIEIVYGPLSSVYGADAVGGVIHIFTKQGQGAPSATAFAGAGSNRTRAADAALSGATGGAHSVSYAINAGEERSDGFSATLPGSASYNADRDGYVKRSAAGQFRFELLPGHEVGALFAHSRLDAQYDNGAAAFDVRSHARLANAAVFGKARFSPSWSSTLQYAQTSDLATTYSNAGAAGSRLDTRQQNLTWQNDVLVGADVMQLLFDRREEEVSTNGAAALNGRRTTVSLAASYNARRGASLFNASARRDKSAYGNQNTGSIGYAYAFTPALRASASYGSSFRAPTYNELYFPSYGNPANRPEQGRNGEIGVRYDDGVNALGASYYRNRLSGLLASTTPCPYGAADYRFGCAYNVNHALLAGLTMSGATSLAGIDLNASIDLQDPRDETSGMRLARRAQKHASVNAAHAFGALQAALELELSGERFDDAANKNRLGGYGLVNLYATYRFGRDWSALARWNNIGDKQYALARNYASAGSHLFAGIRYGYK